MRKVFKRLLILPVIILITFIAGAAWAFTGDPDVEIPYVANLILWADK